MGNKSFSFTSHGERKDVRKRSGVLIYINVCITIKWIKWVLQVFSHRSAINYGASQPKSFNCLFYQLFVLFWWFFQLGGTNSYKTRWEALKALGYCNIEHNFPPCKHGLGAAGICRAPAAEEPCKHWPYCGHFPETIPERKHQPCLKELAFFT